MELEILIFMLIQAFSEQENAPYEQICKTEEKPMLDGEVGHDLRAQCRCEQ